MPHALSAPNYRRALAMCLLLFAIFSVGCQQSPEPWEKEKAEEALQSFLLSLAYHDLETAWAFLDPADQAILQAQSDALTALDKTLKVDPWLFLSPGHIPSTATEIKKISRDGDGEFKDGVAFPVKVELHSGYTFSLNMTQKDGRWFVDLPLEALSIPSNIPPTTSNPQSPAPEEDSP